MESKQITNPFLPFNEYIPDGEPHIFGDRLYIYGSHDKEGGDRYCILDYICYSASIDNLKDWRYEGVIYKKEDEPDNTGGDMRLFAPDVCQGADGRFYLYYAGSNLLKISVAVCDTPAGEYKFLGHVKYRDGSILDKNWPFDPAVINDDGEIYLYYGFAPTNLDWDGMPDKKDLLGGSVVKLDSDMLTVLSEPEIVIPSETYSHGTGFEGHEYFEAPSIRKIGEVYYLVYSSVLSHELCYATSRYPDRDFTYGGTIISNCNVGYNGISDDNMAIAAGNNHGGLVCVKDQWYIFYHRHTHGTNYSRQACAEPVKIEADGSIKQVQITSCGLNGGPLNTDEPVMAFSCCGLTNGKIPKLFKPSAGEHFPFLTYEKGRYIAKGLDSGSVMTFKYIEIKDSASVDVLCKGTGDGYLKLIFHDHGTDRELSYNRIVMANHIFSPNTLSIDLPPSIYTVHVKFTGEGELDIYSLEFK